MVHRHEPVFPLGRRSAGRNRDTHRPGGNRYRLRPPVYCPHPVQKEGGKAVPDADQPGSIVTNAGLYLENADYLSAALGKSDFTAGFILSV